MKRQTLRWLSCILLPVLSLLLFSMGGGCCTTAVKYELDTTEPVETISVWQRVRIDHAALAPNGKLLIAFEGYETSEPAPGRYVLVVPKWALSDKSAAVPSIELRPSAVSSGWSRDIVTGGRPVSIKTLPRYQWIGEPGPNLGNDMYNDFVRHCSATATNLTIIHSPPRGLCFDYVVPCKIATNNIALFHAQIRVADKHGLQRPGFYGEHTLWYAALPIAIGVDIATSPVQIGAWLALKAYFKRHPLRFW